MASATLLLAVVYAAFISLGLPDGALGVAWPAMRAELGQPLEALGLVTVLLTLGSALSGFASGRVLARLGTPRVVLLSGLATGLSLLGFALAPSYALIIILALPLGFGAGSVDAGLNHYAAERWSSRHMNWLHASWGLGATLGPLAVTMAIALGSSWRSGYFIISGAQLSLALIFLLSLGLWDKAPPHKAAHAEGPASAGAATKKLALILAPLGYALYAGVEVGIGAWAASVLRDGRGFSPGVAGGIAAAYYAAITLGRVISGLIADRVGNRRMVRAGLAVAGLGLGLFAIDLGPLAALTGIVFIGLGYAPIYPCLMHETPRRFDAATTRKVVGRQVASAYLGGMLLPPLIGLAAGSFGLWAVAPMAGLYLALLALDLWLLDRLTPPLRAA
jgi:fucose permease